MRSLPVLYSFRRCPFAIRARLALVTSGSVCTIREVELSAKPAELLSASPKGTVPVLVLPEAGVLEQSLDIMRWALSNHDPARWLDQQDSALIETNDGLFKHHLDRTKYPERHGSDAESHRAACIDLLRPLDARLKTKSFLCGDAMGLVDAAILPFVRQFAAIDRARFDGEPLPYLRCWLNRLVSSELFEAAMVRLTPWRAGDQDVLFPQAAKDMPSAG